LENDDAIFQNDFLEDIINDLPVDCWSMQKDIYQNMAIIRNNEWKGFTAYHIANTKEYGCLYVGDGLKNENFCFMI
jgi:hypothetical protein